MGDEAETLFDLLDHEDRTGLSVVLETFKEFGLEVSAKSLRTSPEGTLIEVVLHYETGHKPSYGLLTEDFDGAAERIEEEGGVFRRIHEVVDPDPRYCETFEDVVLSGEYRFKFGDGFHVTVNYESESTREEFAGLIPIAELLWLRKQSEDAKVTYSREWGSKKRAPKEEKGNHRKKGRSQPVEKSRLYKVPLAYEVNKTVVRERRFPNVASLKYNQHMRSKPRREIPRWKKVTSFYKRLAGKVTGAPPYFKGVYENILKTAAKYIKPEKVQQNEPDVSAAHLINRAVVTNETHPNIASLHANRHMRSRPIRPYGGNTETSTLPTQYFNMPLLYVTKPSKK